LTLHDQRVNDAAEIVGVGEVDKLDRAGLAIDFDLGDIGAGRISEVDGIIESSLVEAGFQRIDGIVVRDIGGEGHLSERHGAIRTSDREFAVGKFDIGLSGLEQMSGDLLGFGDDLIHGLD
jgi:hypothetical protein